MQCLWALKKKDASKTGSLQKEAESSPVSAFDENQTEKVFKLSKDTTECLRTSPLLSVF